MIMRGFLQVYRGRVRVMYREGGKLRGYSLRVRKKATGTMGGVDQER